MNYKPNLPSSYYTRYKSRALLTSYMGRVSVQKMPLWGHLWRLTTRDGRLALASNVGCVKYKTQTANRPNLKSKALTSLKWWQIKRNWVLHEVAPFLKFAHNIIIIPATVQHKNLHGNESNHNMQTIMWWIIIMRDSQYLTISNSFFCGYEIIMV